MSSFWAEHWRTGGFPTEKDEGGPCLQRLPVLPLPRTSAWGQKMALKPPPAAAVVRYSVERDPSEPVSLSLL